MKALNYIEIETKSGYRSFELHCGDLSNLNFEVDIIIISAFRRMYHPVPNTVIGSLYERGIDVRSLSYQPLFDFREGFDGWVSKKIKGYKYKYILCMDMSNIFLKNRNINLEYTIRDLFTILSILEVKRLKIKSIALPLIGTGLQEIDPKKLIKILIDGSLDFLQHSRYLEKIIFVEYKEDKANELNTSMDEVLGRTKIKIPRGPLVNGIKQEIIGDIDIIINIIGKIELFSDLRQIIGSDYCRAFELGGIARKTIEFIIQDIYPSKKYYELWKKIDLLSNIRVAPWILGYMHLLRVFGNEAVHDKSSINRNPSYIDEKDLELCLFCLQRVLNFYLNLKQTTC
jgi:hypothetical protein